MIIVLPGEYEGLNEVVGANRKHKMLGAKIKKEETERAYWEIKAKRLKPITEGFPLIPRFTWITKNLKKDADNVASAKKFILDGMVLAGLIPNDTRRYIGGFGGDAFEVDATNPRVIIHINE